MPSSRSARLVAVLWISRSGRNVPDRLLRGETTVKRQLALSLLDGTYGICRLPAAAGLPDWTLATPLFSITATESELTIVCPWEAIPSESRGQTSWRCLRIDGSFALDETGVLASVAEPLAEAGISIFVVSSYDTDFILVKKAKVETAVAALAANGHAVNT